MTETVPRPSPLACPVTWTRHAIVRAAERFPGVDMTAALAAAHRPAGRARAHILRQIPLHAREHRNGGAFTENRYLLYSREHESVFVIAAWPHKVVTVFPYDPDYRPGGHE